MKFILEDAESVKQYYNNYDYGTSDVRFMPDGKPHSDIFDTSTIGGYSGYDKYMQNKEKYIQRVTPNQYFEQCAKGFGTSINAQIKQVEGDKDILDYLEYVLLDKKKKFPMTCISKSDGSKQEGRHKMYVAAKLFGWNHSFPVLVID